ncbi:unnamed protein product [Rotaria sp. Silwood2]|nr:unnamed protein product [Rotaria sp. Silwood2]CAF3475556.1 unnamed protein product [Rotaria sp. Silwood2]CAF4455337.1 unnamed protein product [Rotaria sp. Silwood2]
MIFLKWRTNSEFVNVLNHLEDESNENIIDHDHKNDNENFESAMETSTDEPIDTNTVLLPLNVAVSSHGECCICRKVLKSGLCTVSELDRDFLFIKSNIFIEKGSRCCEEHIVNGRLHIDALNQIRPNKTVKSSFSSSDILIWFSKFRDHCNSLSLFDFSIPFYMSDIDCYNLTGISKDHFNHLSEKLSNSSMQNSFNRSIRNALGLFLTKLRLELSNKVLTTMFKFSNPKAVSRILSTVREALSSEFVPQYLGFQSISRQDVINTYSSPLATRLLSEDMNTVVLVADGTYSYLQVLVDRGFRDSVGLMRALGLDVCMHDFLNGRHRFEALEANRSRFISKIRWVVESAHARIKHFKWLNQTIQNSTIPQVRDYLRIACALVNAYRSSAISSFMNDDIIVTKMLENLHEPNLLRVRINDEILRWVDGDASQLVNFPVLSIDQIRTITVGVFQLKQARSYCEEHCSTTHLDNRADFPLQICVNDPQLIRIRFKSRHSNTKTYYTYISFSTQDILNSCCDCPGGDRKVGVC